MKGRKPFELDDESVIEDMRETPLGINYKAKSSMARTIAIDNPKFQSVEAPFKLKTQLLTASNP